MIKSIAIDIEGLSHLIVTLFRIKNVLFPKFENFMNS